MVPLNIICTPSGETASMIQWASLKYKITDTVENRVKKKKGGGAKIFKRIFFSNENSYLRKALFDNIKNISV